MKCAPGSCIFIHLSLVVQFFPFLSAVGAPFFDFEFSFALFSLHFYFLTTHSKCWRAHSPWFSISREWISSVTIATTLGVSFLSVRELNFKLKLQEQNKNGWKENHNNVVDNNTQAMTTTQQQQQMAVRMAPTMTTIDDDLRWRWLTTFCYSIFAHFTRRWRWFVCRCCCRFKLLSEMIFIHALTSLCCGDANRLKWVCLARQRQL